MIENFPNFETSYHLTDPAYLTLPQKSNNTLKGHTIAGRISKSITSKSGHFFPVLAAHLF